jgi:hypothetical protein
VPVDLGCGIPSIPDEVHRSRTCDRCSACEASARSCDPTP